MLIKTHETAKALHQYCLNTGRTVEFSMPDCRAITFAINQGKRNPFIDEIRSLADIAPTTMPKDRSYEDNDYTAEQRYQRRENLKNRSKLIYEWVIEHPSSTRQQILEHAKTHMPYESADKILRELLEQDFVYRTKNNGIWYYTSIALEQIA